MTTLNLRAAAIRSTSPAASVAITKNLYLPGRSFLYFLREGPDSPSGRLESG